jgi:hypothetical protein
VTRIRWRFREDIGGFWSAKVGVYWIIGEPMPDGTWSARFWNADLKVTCTHKNKTTAARGVLAALLAMRSE